MLQLTPGTETSRWQLFGLPFSTPRALAKSGVGNLSLVAGQKQALQGMTGRTNFPPTIPFSLLFVMSLKLGNLWNFNQIHSSFSQFITKAQNTKYNTSVAQCGFS